MPMLATGYKPAAIPEPGEEALAPIEVTGEEQNKGGVMVDDHQLRTDRPLPAGPELRLPGTDFDHPLRSPAAAFFLREHKVMPDDGDQFTVNTGVHVAQEAGHAEPYGTQAGQAPIFGSTWRLEPQPADTGLYIGTEVA